MTVVKDGKMIRDAKLHGDMKKAAFTSNMLEWGECS